MDMRNLTPAYIKMCEFAHYESYDALICFSTELLTKSLVITPQHLPSQLVFTGDDGLSVGILAVSTYTGITFSKLALSPKPMHSLRPGTNVPLKPGSVDML